jgi:DNA-binding transcriptional regulator LsrR (DeoR family)
MISTAPTDRGTTALMAQAARLYFDRQRSKVEIAAALGISRFRVARLIGEALDTGLVRIEYRDTPSADRELAAEMEERFGIDLCVVAGGSHGDAAPGGVAVVDSARSDVARLAASIIDDLVGSDEVVGIAWGSTLAAVVSAVPARTDPSIAVVQLAGSSVRLDRGEDPAEVSRRLAERWGAAHHPLFAPAFVDGPRTRAALSAQPDVAATVALFERVTTAVVGIGALGSGDADGSSLARSGAIDAGVLDELVGRGVVGDVLLHPVAADGSFPATDLAARAMAISIEGLRAVPRVVAVAAGARKGAAIRGALRSGIVRILITDSAAAAASLGTDS